MTNSNTSDSNATRLTTPEAILAFPHLFKPWGGPKGDQEPKYAATLVFTREAQQTPAFQQLRAAIVAALRAKWGDKAEAMTQREGFRKGLRTDIEKWGYPEGSMFLIARNKVQPLVVSRYADPADGKAQIITDAEQVVGNPNEMYAGCTVRAMISVFAYDNVGIGVSFGLDGLQRLGEGERRDNRRNVREVFEADLSEAPASLADVTGQDAPSGDSLDSMFGG
jgi:hypothetical protein